MKDRTFVNSLQHKVTGSNFIVLTYHGILREPLNVPDYCFVSEAQFRADMQTLKDWKFENLSLVEGVRRSRAKELTRPSFAVTFDDGFAGVIKYGLPILSDFGFKATVFLNPQIMLNNKTIWFCEIIHALSTTKKSNLLWRDKLYDLSSTTNKIRSCSILQQDLKRLSHEHLASEVENIQNILNTLPVPKEHEAFRLATPEDVHTASRGHILDFGGHTQNHSILTQTSSWKQEIEESIQFTESITQKKCTSFAYPNGSLCDFNSNHSDLLKSLGLSVAVSNIDGINGSNVNPFAVRRISVGPTPPPFHSSLHQTLSLQRMLYRRLLRSSPIKIPQA